MKKQHLILLPLLLAGLVISTSSCKKWFEELVKFNVDYDVEFTIPATLNTGAPVNLPTPAVTTNISDEFESQDTKAEYVEEINLEQMRLTVLSPPNTNFSFLKDIYVYVSAQNEPEVLIAYQENIPNNSGNQIELTTREVNLKPYVLKDQFQVRTEVVIDETILSDRQVELYMNFLVRAKNPGIL